jgi:hypothetical protein
LLEGKHDSQWSKQDKEKRIQLQSDIDACKEHRVQLEHQRGEFKRQVNSLAVGEAIVVFDFKENIKLLLSREHSSHEFYETPQRTVFGAAGYFRSSDGEIDKVYFDFVNDNLTHDAYAVCFYTEQVLDHPFFDTNRLKVKQCWTDGASHFRNGAVARVFFDRDICWNYFIQYHGKSICDARFSLISRWLAIYSRSFTGRIDSTQDVLAAIQLGEKRAKENAPKSKHAVSFQLVVKPPAKVPDGTLPTVKFDHIKSFYSFFGKTVKDREEKCLMASILFDVDRTKYKYLSSSYNEMKLSQTTKEGFADVKDDNKSSFDTIMESCKKKLAKQKLLFDELSQVPSPRKKRREPDASSKPRTPTKARSAAKRRTLIRSTSDGGNNEVRALDKAIQRKYGGDYVK